MNYLNDRVAFYRGSIVKLESEESASSLTTFTPFTADLLTSYQGNTTQSHFFVFPLGSLNWQQTVQIQLINNYILNIFIKCYLREIHCN